MADTTSVATPYGVIAYDDSFDLSRYMRMARSYPVLSQEEEDNLVRMWIEKRSEEAAQKLVLSHMRLVVKVAMRYKNYGLAMADIVSEGVLGLVKAVKKFDPNKGARFGTYAKWWVRAHIQSFIISSWSLVKVGTTTAQRRLFMGLRSIKNKIMCFHGVDTLGEDNVKMIAKELDVAESDVLEMDARMSYRDMSLNVTVGDDSSCELQDLVLSHDEGHSEALMAYEARSYKASLLHSAIQALSKREKDIIVSRKLIEPNITLESLAKRYNISTERVRQIQEAAMKKIKDFVSAQSSKPALGTVSL